MPRKAKQPSDPDQLPLAMAAKATGPLPEQEAKVALARRAKVSAIAGHLKLVFTLDLPREVAERLVARAIREGKNLDALVAELLQQRAD